MGLLRAVKRGWHRKTPPEPAPASRGEEKHEGGGGGSGGGNGGPTGLVVEEAAGTAGPSVAYRRLEEAERRLLRLTK